MTFPATTVIDDTPKVSQRKKAPERGEGNPAKAGWGTKIFLTVLCVLWMVPIIGTLVTSFRPLDDANGTGWWEVFTHPGQNLGNLTFDIYTRAWENSNMGNAFINSLAIALPATFIPILIAAFAAYGFAWMRFRGRKVMFAMVVAMLVVPLQVALIPILRDYSALKINGTFLAVWLAHTGFGLPLATYLLYNYISQLPRDILESAFIDGASPFTIFLRLILPLSVPALASFAIFQFLWVWNDLLIALLFLGPGEKEVVTVTVAGLVGSQNQGWQLLTAGAIISMIVPVLVFISLQRFFVRGLTAGSVKG